MSTAPRLPAGKTKTEGILHCMLPDRPHFSTLLLPFPASRGAFKPQFTFAHKQRFIFLSEYIFHDFTPRETSTFFGKEHWHIAQFGIVFANKASSEVNGSSGHTRNAALALRCLDYLPVFAQHSVHSHCSFRKAFHTPYPTQRNSRTRAGTMMETD